MPLDSLHLWLPYLRARLTSDERGASLVEYALLGALIAVVCIVAISFLGTNASQTFSNVGSQINPRPEGGRPNRLPRFPGRASVIEALNFRGRQRPPIKAEFVDNSIEDYWRHRACPFEPGPHFPPTWAAIPCHCR